MCQALCKEKHIASFPARSWEAEQECEIKRNSEELGSVGSCRLGLARGDSLQKMGLQLILSFTPAVCLPLTLWWA